MDGRLKGRWGHCVGLSFMFAVSLGIGKAEAIFLDQAETLRFNGRIYNRTAFSTEGARDNTRLRTPYNDGNMLQNRTLIHRFIESLSHRVTDSATIGLFPS